MKTKCEILILLVIFLLSSNVLALGGLLSEDCLSPSLKIQAQDIYGQFKSVLNGQGTKDIDSQLIKDAQELMRSYSDNIYNAQSRIILAAIDDLNLRKNRTEITKILEQWLNDQSDSVSKKREQLFRNLNYEILGNQTVRDINTNTGFDFKITDQRDLSACGTRAFFNYHVLYNLGGFKPGDIVTIENDKKGINYIFTAIKHERKGKIFFQIIDSLGGKKIICEDLGLSAQDITEIQQEVLINKEYRIHTGKEAVRFSLAYILNNIGAMSYESFLDSRKDIFLKTSEEYLKRAITLAPEYATPKRNFLQVLQMKNSAQTIGTKVVEKAMSTDIQSQIVGLNEAQRYFAEKIIAQGGKITFAEFMQDALYSEHGFFTNHVVVGRDQSFDTYAESLPFGYALAKQITEMWEKMGKPDKFSIVEMGAGSGALVKNIMAYIQQNEPELFKILDYVIVEISPKLKKTQEETLEKEFSSLDNVPVRWSKGTAFDLSELKDIEGVFLSNEMPDSFPIHRVKKVNGQIKEIYTVFREGKFQDEAVPISTQDLQDYVNSLEVEIKEGMEVPVNLNLRIWQENIEQALKKGFVITIDYGGKIEEVTQNPYAVWNKETNAIEDDKKKIEYLYENSGNCDITSEINFYDLAYWGRKNGLQVQGYTLQRDFLWNMDFDGISDDLTRKGVIIPRRKSIANDIATNFHFKVLIQSKNVDQEIKLQGLDGMEDLYQPYNKNIYLTLSIGPEQSKFIVITNDVNFNKEIIRKGKQSIKDNIGNGYGFGGKTKIIEANDSNVENGKYIINLSRQELLDITIYNEQGQALFKGWDYFENQGKGKGLSIDYEEFEQKYLTNFDLTNMQSDIIPDMFYLHQDGSLQTFSPEFLSGQLDKQLSPENSLNKKIEQAI